MLGTLNDTEIEDVLHRQLVARLGCHSKGTTYVVPVSYAYDGSHIYIHTNDGMKYTMMRENPSVCLQIDDMANMANWRSVVTWGLAEELVEEQEKKKAIAILSKRVFPVFSSEKMQLSADWPFPDEENTRTHGHLFRIGLTKKSGRFERSTANTYYAT